MTISQHIKELRKKGEHRKADALYDAYVTLTVYHRQYNKQTRDEVYSGTSKNS